MKAIKYLIALLLMAVPAMAQIDRTTLQDAVSYPWSAANISPGSYTNTFRVFSDAANHKYYYLRSFQSASDSEGKTYHYIVGPTADGADFWTDPVDTRGYKSYTFLMFASDAGRGAVATATSVVIASTGVGIAVGILESPLPADDISFVGGDYAVSKRTLNNGLALFQSTDIGVGIRNIAGTHSRKISFPTASDRGLYQGDLGSVARFAFYITKGATNSYAVNSVGSATCATDHIIIRFEK